MTGAGVGVFMDSQGWFVGMADEIMLATVSESNAYQA